MEEEIRKALTALIGKPLWTCRRAADMATFQFGLRIKGADFYGKPTEFGEYALHIQCAWRIRRGDEILVGSRDLYYPAAYQSEEEEFPQDFNWDKHPNRRDELLHSLFNGNKQGFVVCAVEAVPAGTVQIRLSEGLSLDIFPDDSIDHERWRLLRHESNEPHFVVTSHGIET